MTMLADLHLYESEAERHAVCAELARMLRIVPAHLSSATSDPGRNPLPAPAGVVGDSSSEQGAIS